MMKKSNPGNSNPEKDSGDEIKDVARELKTFTTWIISTLIDAIFLSIWVVVQWTVNNFIVSKLELTGIDSFVFTIFQVLLALLTISPVAIYVYTDIRIMIVKSQRRIKREIDMSGTDE